MHSIIFYIVLVCCLKYITLYSQNTQNNFSLCFSKILRYQILQTFVDVIHFVLIFFHFRYFAPEILALVSSRLILFFFFLDLIAELLENAFKLIWLQLIPHYCKQITQAHIVPLNNGDPALILNLLPYPGLKRRNLVRFHFTLFHRQLVLF